MAIFYHSLAKPDRDVLKLPIRGYVQANSAISSFEERLFNQLEKSTTNIQKQTVRSDWRGRSRTQKIEEEASQTNEADGTGRGGHRSAIWRTGHAADRANIQKQTVRSDWRGRSSTQKIEEEVSQTNEADETGRGGHRLK